MLRSVADPTTIDRFEVIRALGSGAFATVWLARDPVLDLHVAIKVLADNWSRDRLIRSRFIDEARVLWQSTSTRIVRVHDVGELDDGRPYFVMALADRGTLAGRIDANNEAGTAFTVAQAAGITAEVARAVADVHDSGRIHRDIKPGNILVTSTESRSAIPIPGLAPDERLVLADFGLARSVDASAVTFISGSPAYVAPEQAGGLDQLSEMVDLYPLGIIATELATGTRPAHRASMAEAAAGRITIADHFTEAGLDPGPGFLDLTRRLLDPDPANRPDSALDVAEDFAALANPEGAVHQPVGDRTHRVAPPISAPTGGGAGPRRRRRLMAIPVVAGVLAAAAIGFVAVTDDGDGNNLGSAEPTTTVTASTPTSTPTSDSTTGGAAQASFGTTPFPFPEVAVVTTNTDEAAVAVIAAPLQDVIDFYEQQTHDGWTVDAPIATGADIRFQMASDDRLADVLLTPTAEDVGDGVIEIAVTYRDL